MNKMGISAVLATTWLIFLTQQTTAQTSQSYAYIARTTLCRVALNSPHSREEGIEALLARQQGVSIKGVSREQISQAHNNCRGQRRPAVYDLQGRLRLAGDFYITIIDGGELWLSCTSNDRPVNIAQVYKQYTQDAPIDPQMEIATWINRTCTQSR